MPEEKYFTKDLLNAVLATHDEKVARGVSAANAVQTVTQAAPGVGKLLHIVGVIAYYSDGSDHELTVNFTAGGAQTLTVKTGAQVILTDLDIRCDENTLASVDAPAGGVGITSTVQLLTYEEDVS